MQNILITGISGQLGHELKGLSYTHSYKAYKFFLTGRSDLDITNHEQVKRFFGENKIDCIINCAAFTGVDAAESETELAMNANGYAVERLVAEAAENNARVIHVSTDYVFDGTNHKPYRDLFPIRWPGRDRKKASPFLIRDDNNYHIYRKLWHIRLTP